MSIRITDSYLSAILVGDLNRSLGSLFEQQRLAGSMQRVNSYADDPRAVGSIQRINDLLTRNADYLRNVSRSRMLVDATDIALQDLTETLADVRILAMRESSSLANADTMTNAAFEVETLVGRMMEVLNTSVEGHFIFAGSDTSTIPFELVSGRVTYRGNGEEVMGRTGPNSKVPLNIPGDVFMGSDRASLVGSTHLGPALTEATLLSEINGGAGWNPGAISLTTGGVSFKIDLTGAVTVGDVLSRIEIDTKGAVTAALSPSGLGLSLSAAEPLTVSEAGEGTTAASLGLTATTPAAALVGDDIRLAPDPGTPLGAIPQLAGMLPLGSLTVTTENGATDVDLSGAQTLGDVQALFGAAMPGMVLQLQDGAFRVEGPDAATFTISDADPGATATNLGIAGEGTPVRLFGVMEDLQEALRAGDKDAVQGAIGELMSLSSTVSGLLIKNGARQNDLDWAEGMLMQRDERLRTNLSLEQDVDVAQVAADLSRAEASYQASLLVTSKLFENNLIMYLR
jgi:flagellin-like hook-associated protein FlgL